MGSIEVLWTLENYSISSVSYPKLLFITYLTPQITPSRWIFAGQKFQFILLYDFNETAGSKSNKTLLQNFKSSGEENNKLIQWKRNKTPFQLLKPQFQCLHFQNKVKNNKFQLNSPSTMEQEQGVSCRVIQFQSNQPLFVVVSTQAMADIATHRYRMTSK